MESTSAASGSKSLLGAGRYAPSPSGDLHLGNLRTALLAWLFARASGRAFIIRIEDLDRDRDVGSAQSQLDDLRAIGIDWDGEPTRQSSRSQEYAQVIARLRAQGLVYECTCTRREILEAPTAPHSAPGAYPGTCRARSEREREQAREAIYPRQPALRLLTPEHLRTQKVTDLLLGELDGKVDDMVLQRGDGTIAYNLAVVVDDAAAGVDQVVRGDDLASSTPRQIALQKLLDLPQPEYAHVPLVLGPTGARLAKRDGAVTLKAMHAQGVDAASVRNVITTSLGLTRPGEKLEMYDLLDRFDARQLPRVPWRWHPEHE